MSIEPMSINHIDPAEARRRIEELAPLSELGHEYSRTETGVELADGTPETDGDHVVHLGIMAVAYALKYRPGLDPGRVALYVLLHDIDEAKVGDTPTLGVDEAALYAKKELEAEGRKQVEEDAVNFPEFIELLRSLSDLERPEDTFGKAFDKLAPGYLHSVTHGKTLVKYGITSHQGLLRGVAATDAKMAEYAANHPDVIAMRAAIHDQVSEAASLPEE